MAKRSESPGEAGKYVNMYQAAQIAGVTRQAIYDAVRRKALPSEVRVVTVKIRRIKVADLLDYMRRTGGRRGRGASKK